MANTRPIARLRFPPRFKKKRVARPYTSSFYEAAAVAFDGTTGVSELADYEDFIGGPLLGINSGPHLIHRLMFKGDIVVTAQTTAAAIQAASLCWAVCVKDRDDQDIGLWAAAGGNAFANYQILKWNVDSRVYTELAGFPTGDNRMGNKHHIQFDLKFRKPLRFPVDSHIVLLTEWNTSIAPVVGGALLYGIIRTVIQPAGTGR